MRPKERKDSGQRDLFRARSSVPQLATSAILVSVVVIISRFVWTFPATYLPRWLIPAVRRADPSPPLAVAVRALVHGSARRCIARSDSRHSTHNTSRRSVLPTRPDSLPDFQHHPRDARWAGIDSTLGNASARPRQCRNSGTPRRSYGGAGRAAAGRDAGRRIIGSACERGGGLPKGDRSPPRGSSRPAGHCRPTIA